MVLKGTNVDGVYDCDPRKSNNAIIDHISYRDFTAKGLSNAMDITTITLCEENCIPGELNDFSSHRIFFSHLVLHKRLFGLLFLFFLSAFVVFNLHELGNISRALSGDQIGTLIDQMGKIG